MKYLAGLFFCVLSLQLSAQQKKYNYLYQFGIADAFLAGLYHGTLNVSTIKQHGDFGLGAPDMLNGELVIDGGKAYQTRADGITTPMADTAKIPLVLADFFKADTAFYINTASDKRYTFNQIDKYLKKKNGLYAVRITGEFQVIKTRAFPPVNNQPFLPLADMLDRQHFFSYQHIAGTLIGFKLPAYLSSVTIADYHFHFLSADKKRGGHMTDMTVGRVKVEVAALKGIDIQIPQDAEFMNFDFRKIKKGDAEKAEK